MKRITILCFAALTALAASCDRKPDFKDMTAVYFPNTNIRIDEDADIYDIPIKLHGEKRDFAVTFEAVDGTSSRPAEEGVDYEIYENPATIVPFSSSDDTKYIRVKVTNRPGVMTGNKDFSIKLKNATNGVITAGTSTCKVTIMDNDHPLKTVFGAYDAKDNSGAQWTVTLLEDPSSTYNVLIDGITPTFAGKWVEEGEKLLLSGTVGSDLKTIRVAYYQSFMADYDGETLYMFGVDNNGYIISSGSAIFTATEDGFTFTNGQGLYMCSITADNSIIAYDMAEAPIVWKKRQ